MLKKIVLTLAIVLSCYTGAGAHGYHLADYNMTVKFIEWVEGGALADTVEFGWIYIHIDGDLGHQCLHFNKIY